MPLPKSSTPRTPTAAETLLDLPKFSREISVMAWVEDACGNFLMVRQAQGKRLWTLPGGKVKATEGLEVALRREVYEETGERVRTARITAVFDRPTKRSLTILYRVTLIKQRLRAAAGEEIADMAFKSRLPVNASPSARYFCPLMRETGGGH